MKRKNLNKIIFWIVGTLVLSLALSGAIQKNWFQLWHFKSSNFFFFQSTNETLNDIVIVAIDNKAFEMKNASELGTLKFNKADYARVIENLEAAGAKAIGVDIIFSEISDEADRKTLSETLKKYNNIILAAEPKIEQTFGLKPLEEFIAPHPENLGAILFSPDRDNTVRRQTLFFEDPKSPEAFSLKIVKTYLGLIPEDSQKTDTTYRLMDFPVRIGAKKFDPIEIPLSGTSGKTQNKTTDELIINFFGRPYSYPSISFADLYENRFTGRQTQQPIELTDKIVLIGEMGTGIHDEQYVPASFGQAMPGVEIHANAIQTILTQRFLTEQSARNLTATVTVITAVALAAFLTLGITFSLILFFTGLIVYMVTTWVVFEYGLILNTIYPYLAMLAALVTAYIYRYFTEAKLTHEIENAFSHYVSDIVVKKILEDPESLALGGVKKEMTVLFSDIADFTKITEATKAEKLVNQLNDYLDAMGEVILKREGTLDKFIGDAIVAFWSAPITQIDHAVRACLSALEYQAKLKTLRTIWEKEGLLPFTARIGINTGEMIVGNMGSNRRFDYTVIGDAVNLGARLEGANKFYGTDILISESTYLAAKHAIEAREIDIIKVKGKTKVVRIYELMGKTDELTHDQRQLIEHFAEGLAEYRKQRWGEAIRLFSEVLKIDPKDGPSSVFIERCKNLIHKNLPTNWDGVFELTGK